MAGPDALGRHADCRDIYQEKRQALAPIRPVAIVPEGSGYLWFGDSMVPTDLVKQLRKALTFRLICRSEGNEMSGLRPVVREHISI